MHQRICLRVALVEHAVRRLLPERPGEIADFQRKAQRRPAVPGDGAEPLGARERKIHPSAGRRRQVHVERADLEGERGEFDAPGEQQRQ